MVDEKKAGEIVKAEADLNARAKAEESKITEDEAKAAEKKAKADEKEAIKTEARIDKEVEEANLAAEKEQKEVLEQATVILKRYGVETNIPLDSDYWRLMGRYRTLSHQLSRSK